MNEPTSSLSNPQSFPVEFKGTAQEYFRIWIVNTFLTIITFGIYSAWAKVRKRKYFYRNTYLANDSFDYHADPKKILIGRLIVAVLFIAYAYGPLLNPIIGVVAFLIFIVAFPWLIVRGAIFNYRNTSYRNIRFNFKKDYKESYSNYIVSGLVVAFTFGLMFPYALYRHYNFILNRILFGTQKVEFNSDATTFFAIIYKSIGLYLLLAFGVAFPILAVSNKMTDLSQNPAPVFIVVVLVYATMAAIYGYQRAHIANTLANRSNLQNIKFQSNLKFLDVSWIYLSNLVVVILTLGLATPWAKIRSLKYRMDHTTVIATPEDFDQFINQNAPSEGHIADAGADFWDIDFGL